jgi:broad specificity phosphatase PhoE
MSEGNFTSRPEAGSLRLFLVRHGETDANRLRLLQGGSNGLLNANGRLQAEQLGRHLSEIALDRVYASDLQRAVDTAQTIAQLHGLSVEVDRRLREWDVGSLDGQPAAVYLQMIQDSGKPLSQFDPPGGEKLGEVRSRAEAFLQMLVEQHTGESILACSHGDCMRMLTGVMLQVELDAATAFHFDNASYSIFEWAGSRWRVIALNRTATDCE